MPLRHGHLAQLIACGSIKGVVFDKDQKNPLIVKGITKKTVDYRIEKEGDTEKQIETDRIVITINAINRKEKYSPSRKGENPMLQKIKCQGIEAYCSDLIVDKETKQRIYSLEWADSGSQSKESSPICSKEKASP